MTPSTTGSIRVANQSVDGPAPSFLKLKPGPGRPAAAVSANQRARLQRAITELITERGYEGVTVRGLSNLAGVSTRTFYSHFGNVDECLGETYEATTLAALDRMKAACAVDLDWEGRIHCGVESILRSAAREPRGAEMALVGAFSGGSATRACLRSQNAAFERVIFSLFPMLNPHARGSHRLVVGMVAGLTRILRKTTMAGRATELPGLAEDLTDWLLAIAGAGSISHRTQSVAVSRRGPRRESDPFPDRINPSGQTSVLDDRAIILRATAKLAAAVGPAGLTPAGIRSKAGISKRTFNRYFSNTRECFLETVEWLATGAAARAADWAQSAPVGTVRTQRLVLALCAQAARSEPLANVVLVQLLDAERDGLLCEDRLMSAGATRLGADILPAAAASNPIAAEASTAALWRIASTEASAGRTKQLPQLAPGLVRLVLAPGRPA